MKEITQYTLKGVATPINKDSPNLTRWVKHDDYVKVIEAKDKEIERLKEALKNALDGYASSDMLFKEEIEEIIELRKLTK